MPQKSENQIKVTVNIVPGPVTPAQRQAWKKFWQKLIAEAKSGEDK